MMKFNKGSFVIIGVIVVCFAILGTLLLRWDHVSLSNKKNVEGFYGALANQTDLEWSVVERNPDKVITGWSGKVLADGTWDSSVENISLEQFEEIQRVLRESRELVGFCSESYGLPDETICSYENRHIGCRIMHSPNEQNTEHLNIEFSCYSIES